MYFGFLKSIFCSKELDHDITQDLNSYQAIFSRQECPFDYQQKDTVFWYQQPHIIYMNILCHQNLETLYWNFFLQLERHLWFCEFEIDSSSIVNNTVEVTTDYATKNYNTTEASDTVIDADNFLSEFVKNTIIGKMGKTIFLCNKFEFII